MQIKTDENGNIIQTASVGEIPGGTDIDLSMYKYVDGSLIPNEEKIRARQKAVRTAEIKARLSEIDFESIRPLRAKADGNSTEEDEAKLSALEAEAVTLREELEALK